MRRSVFAIAVAMMLMAAPLFGAQAEPQKQPAAKTPQASEAKPKPSTTTPAAKPAAATKPAASAKPAPATKQAAATKPAATKPAATAKPASVKAPSKPTATAAKPATTAAKTAPPAKAGAPAAKSPAKVAKADAKPAAKPAKAEPKDARKAVASSASPKPTATTAALTPVQEKLHRNASLTRKLQPRLPEGTDVTAAAAGFKSLNAFVSAVNVSANLHIPFDKLKAKIVTEKKSLSQAIQALKPASSAAIEVQRAEYDARGMIAESEAEQAAAPAPVSQQPKAKSKPSPKRAVGG